MEWTPKTNPDGTRIVENDPATITAHFFEDGELTTNTTTGTITWNSPGVVHMNIMAEDMAVLYDFENNYLMISANMDGEDEEIKHIILPIEELKKMILDHGSSTQDLEKKRQELLGGNEDYDCCKDCTDDPKNCDSCLAKLLETNKDIKENTDDWE